MRFFLRSVCEPVMVVAICQRKEEVGDTIALQQSLRLNYVSVAMYDRSVSNIVYTHNTGQVCHNITSHINDTIFCLQITRPWEL